MLAVIPADRNGVVVMVQAADYLNSWPVECPAVYNPLENLVRDEKFWYDGEHFRFSFTVDKIFCTGWSRKYYSPFNVSSILSPLSVDGESRIDDPSFKFINNVNDLTGFLVGENRFFIWEADKRYDAYLSSNYLSIGGYLYNHNLFEYYMSSGWTKERFTDEVRLFTYNYDSSWYVKRNLKTFKIDFDYFPEPAKPEPVIIIPGILGSWNFGFGWELDPILNTYDNLWLAFKSAGYQEGETLFAFPYNWRLPNIYSAELLKAKINEVKEICQCDKVDVIGHSMGGLVARAYVEMGNYENDIDQLIFLGAPHRGAPKAYLTWESGDIGQTTRDFIYERIFKIEAEFNGYGSVFDYVRQLPMKSIEELLPVYSYLRDQETLELRNYPDNYPGNLFLELLNEPSQLAKLNDIDLINIIADNNSTSTLNYLRVILKDFVDGQWADGYPEGYDAIFGDHGLEYGPGDGTTPQFSSAGFDNFNDLTILSSHNTLATDAQKIIIQKLTGREPAEEFRENSFAKYLLIRLFSPADFLITAPNGQKLGRDFSSGNVINEIDNAFYTGFLDGPEFAVIPDPLEGEYKIDLKGTADGDYQLSASLIGEDSAVDSEYNGQILLGETENYLIGVSNEGLSDLNPSIQNLVELTEEIENMYRKNWLSHFGSKNALLAQLKNGFQNDQRFEQINEFIDNMLEKNRMNQRAYDIIKLALTNIKNNL